ncbi:hypothetical protein PAXRUDRAFT_822574 [Paxillus rubicundulus Ve08.2h10]|uniref:Uncharacterized protein n=1 Tax=Paxillus rubicundulus Ve08.2h10 TaxID=930991 RepID=A0A0D0E4Z7_9AGAM|nr:hypothetical protein PAXRUDRAFT_822574 [Paxillus rubicundulus Ve08.2h10]
MECSSFDSGVHVGNYDDNAWHSEGTSWSQDDGNKNNWVGGWGNETHLDWER